MRRSRDGELHRCYFIVRRAMMNSGECMCSCRHPTRDHSKRGWKKNSAPHNLGDSAEESRKASHHLSGPSCCCRPPLPPSSRRPLYRRQHKVKTPLSRFHPPMVMPLLPLVAVLLLETPPPRCWRASLLRTPSDASAAWFGSRMTRGCHRVSRFRTIIAL